MTNATQATEATKRRDNEQEWDDLQNEGGEGYNPHRVAEAIESGPRSADSLTREINALDCNGMHYAERVDKLRAAIAAAATREMIEQGWTKDVTKARRAEWRKRVLDGEFGQPGKRRTKADTAKLDKAQIDQGWLMQDLKRACRSHGMA